MEIYLSAQNQRLNEVMKVLTVISTLFIPLTFVVGIYGMNFENMPELKTQYGYFVVVGIIALLCTVLYLRFKRARWL